MKGKKHEISSMEHMSFNSKKVLASVVAGLLFAAPVFATVETVAPSLGFAEHVALAEENDSVVHFKDNNLKKALLKVLKNNHKVSDSATEITKADALKITHFSSSWDQTDDDFTSIEGIENFKNLTQLGLGSNQISDIKPLAGLTNLTLLLLNENSISDLTPLANLTNLTTLGLGRNQISDIKPLAGLTNLTSLYLWDNQISDIKPFVGLTNLKELRLGNNQIQNLECLSTLKSDIDARAQKINLQSTPATVDLKKEIKGFGNVTFGSDENISNGVLTHKEGMKNPYQVDASESIDGNHRYSATINVEFSKAKINSEIQTENISEELQKLLDGYNAVKDTDNYKNADDNLKQVYDKAITDGQKVYDKLSSTPEQVKQAQQNIQSAIGALNGDKKAQAIKDQLSTATQQITSLQEQLEKAKQQGVADASTIQSLTQQLQQTKQQLEKLKQDKTLSDQQKQAEIDKLNGQITNLGKQIEKLTQENTSLKGQIATLQATVARLTEEANQCHVSDGAKAQELEKVKQQLTQAQSDLEKLKADKTQSDQEKQKEIDRLSAQVTQLNQEIDKLKQEKSTLTQQLQDATAAFAAVIGMSAGGDANAPASTSAMYRLYNPWTGEHLFTTDAHEVQTLLALGWQDEGIIGQVSMKEGKAVYRLYNPNTGEHHYTTDADEVARCVANGWVKEGIAFYSQGDQAVFSMYNPYAKSFYHHYTSNEKEIAQMIKDGWKKEEVKWYCAPVQPHNLVK